MATDTISVLYVGDGRDHCVLPTLKKFEDQRWYLYAARDLYDALATYILYYPHITVFAGDSALIRSAFEHIASVNNPAPRFVDAVLVFGPSVPGAMPATTLLRHYPLPTREEDVIAAITGLAADRARAEAEIARAKRTRSTMPSGEALPEPR